MRSALTKKLILLLVICITAIGAAAQTRTLSGWKIQCKLPPKTKRFCPLVLK